MPATLDITNPQSQQQAPVDACCFEAPSPVKFAQAGEQDAKEKPVTILARTGDVIDHWWWGRVVHDFAGMRAKPKIALDWNHDANELVGTTDSHSTESGDLVCEARIISLEASDYADKIIKLSDRDVPYEASIYFNPWDLVLEWLPEGMQTEVNGRSVEGPLVIAREWTLHRIAICPTGADYGTQSQFKAEQAASFSLNWKESSMSKSTGTSQPATAAAPATPPTAGQQSADTGTQTATPTPTGDSKAVEQSSEPEGDRKQPSTPTGTDASGKSEFELKLDKFTTKFGAEDGVSYLKGGLSYEQALEKHLEKVQAAQHSAQEAANKANEKLGSLNLGEQTPVDTGTPGSGAGGESGKGDFKSNFMAASKKAKS